MKLQELLEMLLIRRVGICILDAHTLICQTVNDSFLEMQANPAKSYLTITTGTVSGKLPMNINPLWLM